MVGKCAISASFAIIYVFSAELFPTVVRNVAMGLCAMFARFGGIVAPVIADLVLTLLRILVKLAGRVRGRDTRLSRGPASKHFCAIAKTLRGGASEAAPRWR